MVSSLSLIKSLSLGLRLYYLLLYYTTPTFRPALSVWEVIENANCFCVGLLWATVWVGRSERAGTRFCACTHGSVRVHNTANPPVLTVHGHTFQNESFLFISYSCGSNPYFLYYSLIGVEDWSLRLNEFYFRANAGCSFLNLPRNQTSPPSAAA